jgi:RHH-type proline utilization regulon transcriptional repressor/proline dehydrogenase/delta 1-pyrroline-5-carboxylate dehydrogenase
MASRAAIAALYRADETARAEALITEARFDVDQRTRIAALARDLVEHARTVRVRSGGLDAFLHEFDLSTREGVVLMCLAEALLRIPDSDTADALIKDKLSAADWEKHLGKSKSLFVNASTWGLMLTGRLVRWESEGELAPVLRQLVTGGGEPLIRGAVTAAMRILGRQFVMGRTIEEALERADERDNRQWRYSFDMLGEAAHTAKDATRYFDAYAAAIAAIGKAGEGRGVEDSPGISVKLSALHPRYEPAQRERVLRELPPRLLDLARAARDADIGLTVDAEEAARLDLSLDVIEAVFADSSLSGWEGFGLAIQAYQKRAPAVVDWVAELARQRNRRLMVRLVKGAYWDTEIKRAQQDGLDGYPVFTRKLATDVSYLACARRMVADDRIYPQFATHNAHTVAAVLELAGRSPFEFQRLHGMGEALYERLGERSDAAVRVYAPVGSHEELLPYLVRRLLENGANTSFVNRLVDEALPVEEIVADPVERLAATSPKPHPRIKLPIDILGDRTAARGIDLTDPLALADLEQKMSAAMAEKWTASPIVGGRERKGKLREVHDPADRRRAVGRVCEATPALVEEALKRASAAAPEWDALGGEGRATILARAGDMLEARMESLMAIAVREGGKTLPDSVSEVREAVDYCRYYANLARKDFAAPQPLPGPTGEQNSVALHGRGVFACISPWNFPLAIFLGQVAAALGAGNAVIAKPSEQTPLMAAAAIRILHEAGVPGDALHLLIGRGSVVGKALTEDERVAGIAFTGSTETGQGIARALAARKGPIAPLIAETGGQNAMIVDSSALPEQVVTDVIASAFLSAGQRCSCLRVLFLQSEIANRIIEMLTGAMAELSIGNPGLVSTDVGPVIDEDAKQTLARHAGRMARQGKLLYACELGKDTEHGTFFAPRAFEIDGIEMLEREVFGPILHVVRYRASRLDKVVDAINSTGYGLTIGIHSRIDETARRVAARARVGNAYVNRSMVGAVVGVQPFGGEGLSGTGPKAGGPRYLHRFAVERTLSVNTTAAGGNATLMSLADDA